MTDKEEYPVEYGITPIRGYRKWHLPWFSTGQIGELHGLIHNSLWTSPVTEAICDNQKKLSYQKCTISPGDDPDCRCGIHAWHVPEEVISEDLFGVVEGEGRVDLFDFGWRAQRARIKAIYVNDITRGQYIQSKYPEVIIYTDKLKLINDWPPNVNWDGHFGPQGKQAREIVYRVMNLSRLEIVEANKKDITHDDEVRRRRNLFAKIYRIQQEENIPAMTSFVNGIYPARYGYRSVSVAHKLTPAEYYLLIQPWVEEFKYDPLEGFSNFAEESEVE